MRGDSVTRNLSFGVVEANEGYTIEVRRGKTLRRAAFREGNRKVTVIKDEDGERQKVTVRVSSSRVAKVP